MHPDRHIWFFYIFFALLMLLAIPHAFPRELYPGQYADVDPEISAWFRSQKIPGCNELMYSCSCCNEADGTYAEEDIINGRYWARWRIGDSLTAWMPVPPEAVLPKSNRNGSPVVWWIFRDGVPHIRCYAPGSGV
jgi:hypothetical protein